MVDEFALKQIFSLQSAAWTATALFGLFVIRLWNGAPAMFAQWVEWRRTVAEARTAEAGRIAAEKAADWSRLRDEIVRLSDAERKCRADFDDLHDKFIERGQKHGEEIAGLRAEIAELRGFLTGQGRAAQEAAGIVAIERGQRRDSAKNEPPEAS